jgi:hypothetical protein
LDDLRIKEAVKISVDITSNVRSNRFAVCNIDKNLRKTELGATKT